jgi:hypothetical protein
MAHTCKMVGEAGLRDLGRGWVGSAVAFARNVLLGDICYGNCLERCFGKNYCPQEQSAD